MKVNEKGYDENNDDRLLEIRELLLEFYSSRSDDELQDYAVNLLITICQKSYLNIFRGKIEIWAASIVYVIARLNFLFDKSSADYMHVDEICSYFGVNKSTIGNKASQIQDQYGISLGDRKYTKPEIARSFEFNVTPAGFIIPAFSESGYDVLIEPAEGDDLEDLKKYETDQKRKKEREKEEKVSLRIEKERKISEEKRNNTQNQLSLFDLQKPA